MAYTPLSDLSTKQETWSVKVKVMRLWESFNNIIDGLMSLDMVLMDEKVKLICISLYDNVYTTYVFSIYTNTMIFKMTRGMCFIVQFGRT
jgi:hypothetical protein